MNGWTQERARGDAYVRLLTKPDGEGAKKQTKPYEPIILEPDENLIVADTFHLKRKDEGGAEAEGAGRKLDERFGTDDDSKS